MEENNNNTSLATKVGRAFGVILGSVCTACVIAIIIAATTKLIMWMF